jgi:hypothetical protein
MDLTEYNDLLEIERERPLTESESARLDALVAGLPDAALDRRAESLLDEAFAAAAIEPISSNFTSRTLQALDRTLAREPERRWTRVWKRLGGISFRPATAGGVLCVLVVGAAVFAQHREHRLRVEGLQMISAAINVPAVDALEDFDAIRALELAPEPDMDLLLALE